MGAPEEGLCRLEGVAPDFTGRTNAQFSLEWHLMCHLKFYQETLG